MVLLKNENHILPLDKKKLHTIGVIGPNADSRKALVGNYEGTSSRYITVLEGIEDYVGENVRVLYSEGCHLYRDRTSNLAMEHDRDSEARAVCEASDVVIAVVGLDATLEGEEGDTGNEYGSGDKPNLNLPGLQPDIIRIAKESGKPVIVVLLAGSAMALSWEDEHVDAILDGFYPGAQGGAAIAEILFGGANPEGKLPITFYQTTEELPEFTDYAMKGRTYRYMENEALYPFGYGLSYTTYAYGNLECVKPFDAQDGITLQVTVTNTGDREGTETLQVYVKAKREGTPNPQLKYVKKITLKPGESVTEEIHLSPEAFMLYDEKGNFTLEKGAYDIFVGGCQPDARSAALTGNAPQKLTGTYEKRRVKMLRRKAGHFSQYMGKRRLGLGSIWIKKQI